MSGEAVASIGECMLELSGAPQGGWNLNYAGDTFNTLWAMRALMPEDSRTDFVSAFGDDPFSRGQIEFFSANGIGIAESPVIAGANPGLYAITLTGAERSFTYWRKDAAARQLASNPVALAKSLSDRRLIYFSGITLAILTPEARDVLIEAANTARSNGTLIAFDPNYRPRLWQSPDEAKAAITKAINITDIALPTFPDEQMLFGDTSPEATAERLKLAGVGEIVVKDGAEPSLVIQKRESYYVPAYKVEAVDTTGAGDSFNGGYLAAALEGRPPLAAAAMAHRVAATTVQVRGALAPPQMLRDSVPLF